ncbi:hypothetical protein RFI_05813 [Reticulomyxa filosa]|uniref:Uncharacterized protein n=1 Tax=Reticulomyxa filosa TaxID=46433 RepID=X6NZN9_RETFI|nr:hypothetical protein RFI_05813 [Reticulomyxa filosa]|eukprot:ETO31309.1 hypothetical protein RFI_05813 [Reticulomyxa filosa]
MSCLLAEQLQEEKKLTHESYQRELLGVSNAFYGLALEKTVQSGNMNLNSDDKLGLLHKNLDLNGNRGVRNSFELMTSRKGKENIPQFYTTDDLKPKSYDWKNLEFGNSNSASNLNLNSYRSSLSNTYAMAAASNQNKLQQDVSRTRLQQSKNYFGNNYIVCFAFLFYSSAFCFYYLFFCLFDGFGFLVRTLI